MLCPVKPWPHLHSRICKSKQNGYNQKITQNNRNSETIKIL
jgi:hypothetical protein